MTDTQTATGQPHARHIAAGTGEGWWFFDSLMVIQADQPGQPDSRPPEGQNRSPRYSSQVRTSSSVRPGRPNASRTAAWPARSDGSWPGRS